MKATAQHISDSDSGRSPSDDEKHVGVEAGAFESAGKRDLPPDPDAGLSEEERAKIVRNDPLIMLWLSDSYEFKADHVEDLGS